MSDDTNRASLEIRDTAIAAGIVAIVQILCALAIVAVGSGRGGRSAIGLFTPAGFGIVFVAVPAVILVAFSIYGRRRNYSAKPVIALAVLSAVFSFAHLLFWANRMPTV